MKYLILAVVILLSACGGGSAVINCDVASACVLNANNNIVSLPGIAASAPVSGASSPTPTPTPIPVPQVPLGAVFTAGSGYSATVGDLHWTSSGVTYVVSVQEYGFAEAVALMSCTQVDCFGAAQSWTFETYLDDALDMHWPVDSADATLRTYLATHVVPQLDAWIKANQARSVGLVLAPVSSLPVPTSWGYMARIAALLPQWVVVTSSGASLK